MDAQVTAAVLLRLTGPKAGQWAQVRLDSCMVAAHALANTPPVPAGQPPHLPAWPAWHGDHTYYADRIKYIGNHVLHLSKQILSQVAEPSLSHVHLNVG